jgi:hypothetical protein
MDVEVDGVLKYAFIVEATYPGFGPYRMAFGLIHDDRKGRWPDGRPIHTSAILEGPDEQGIIRTLNSVYRVELEQGNAKPA